MKKFLALILALTMLLSLAACGGTDAEDDSDVDEGYEDNADTDGDAADTLTDNNGNAVTQETIQAITEAYNTIAVPYNEIATAANENGWMADEQTAAELNALSTTLGFIGTALTEDITMLDGSDFDALINSLENEFPEALDILSERVSVPYEG